MNADGAAKDDVKVPESDLGKDIQASFDDGKDLLVTIISAMGEEQVGFRHPSPSFPLSRVADCRLAGYFLEGGSQVWLMYVFFLIHPST